MDSQPGFGVPGSRFGVRGSRFGVPGSALVLEGLGLAEAPGGSWRLPAAPCGLPRLPRPIEAGANPQEPASICSSWRLLAAPGGLPKLPRPIGAGAKPQEPASSRGLRVSGAGGSVRLGPARCGSLLLAAPRRTSPHLAHCAPLRSASFLLWLKTTWPPRPPMAQSRNIPSKVAQAAMADPREDDRADSPLARGARGVD